jgi:putative addiction module killer protein
MEVIAREIVMLEVDDGKVPFEKWIDSIKDRSYRRAVDVRLMRVADGNFGDHKSVGKGVYELKIARGPGLRVYYGLDGEQVVVLIGGGDKSTQSQDISTAQKHWRAYVDAHKTI